MLKVPKCTITYIGTAFVLILVQIKFHVIPIWNVDTQLLLSKEVSTKEDTHIRYTKVDFKKSPKHRGFKCLPLHVQPSPVICIHDPDIDLMVSKTINFGILWEENIVTVFQKLLREDDALALIDVGANIGVYSLIAAMMKHQVIAFEPYSVNKDLFTQSIQLNKLQNYITLLSNAVSDGYKEMYLAVNRGNLGNIQVFEKNSNDTQTTDVVTTILLNDIISLISSKKAIMKIDIEGHEPTAILASSKLFESIYIPYVFMEWMQMRDQLSTNTNLNQIVQMVHFFVERDYAAFNISGNRLKHDDRTKWPIDIIWVHKNAAL